MNSTQVSVAQEVAEVAEALESTFQIFYVLTANAVLLIYELFLNFDNEVAYVWRKKFSMSSLLYCCARYGALAVFIWTVTINYLEVYAGLDPAFSAFGATAIFPTFVNVVSYCGIQGLLATRLYAISGGNKGLVSVMLVVLFSDFALTIAAIALDTNPTGQGFLLQKITHLLVVFDTIVFFGTLYKTVGIWKLERELNTSRGISVVFLSSVILCRITLQLRQKYERQIDSVSVPNLTLSFRAFKDTANYVHQALVAEAGHTDISSFQTESISTINYNRNEWENEEEVIGV
ncbi:hypothetical protein Clacol_000303 [Clathrus columnatus]|uniref:DUF6533 domain-containing protein n=1 Tax=Clathrus columnatus TaxID=1419009 RepID=A0AAV5A0B1_9AGAM|nr:hypothetical protein Clacol_000303 [Clathrus columnatus]